MKDNRAMKRQRFPFVFQAQKGTFKRRVTVKVAAYTLDIGDNDSDTLLRDRQ